SDMLPGRLVRGGWPVLVAATGLEAVQMAAEHVPDVILLDLSLPDMDGWTAIRMIRENDVTKDIVVIALVAHVMPRERERALGAWCDGLETRPVDFPRLVDLMSSLAARKEQPCR
ncbi:MAG TPA: response regulator, partial [Bryobacteraceae bacterium]|nr:response regulator [Bryobacteraceae bacterium]